MIRNNLCPDLCPAKLCPDLCPDLCPSVPPQLTPVPTCAHATCARYLCPPPSLGEGTGNRPGTGQAAREAEGQRSASLIEVFMIGTEAARACARTPRMIATAPLSARVVHQSLDTLNCLGSSFKGQVEGTAMRLIGYIRVSTDGQLDGYGLDAQEAAVTAWATANRHRLLWIERDEGVSGSKAHDDRPGLSAALAAIADGRADGLLIPRLDRLARDVATQEAALAHVWRSGGVVFATDGGEVKQDDPDDPMRTAMRKMAAVFAELERGMIAKRMRDGKTAKRAAGRKTDGQYAYGTRATGKGRDRDAGPDGEEQVAVGRMLELRAAGRSYPQICTALAAEGIMPRRAAAWSPMTVRNIILRHSGG